MRSEREKQGWGYYAAIILFIAVLAFAVLGLVRSSSFAGASTGRTDEPGMSSPAASPPGVRLTTGPVATPRIPPPTPSAPTEPPSRTYIYPPPEAGAIAVPGPAAQPRR
ncbi:MAG TPA: hypothetical protein VKS03_05190 [Thermoanaerobaculia bacterium]|nr:hypothetical protein [Thermoanaerobaculia bacterium]